MIFYFCFCFVFNVFSVSSVYKVNMIFVFLYQRPGQEEAMIRDSEDHTIDFVCDLLMVSDTDG